VCGAIYRFLRGKYRLGGVPGVRNCLNNFSHVRGGVLEGWYKKLPGFGLFLGAIFCVGRDFLVRGLYGVLHAGDSS
jgi:hypothetical protein